MVARGDDGNLLVLTLYIIGVTYIFNRMIESIDDQIKVEYNRASVDQQLKDQNLQDKLGISFIIRPMYQIEEPKELSMGIENKSKTLAAYVEWDNCAFIGFDGRSRRAIRKSPDVTRDLAVPQIPSLIVPGKTLKEIVTAEDVFKYDKDAGTYSPKIPIANITGLKSGTRAQKKLYGEFMGRKKNLEFSLQLVLRLSEINAGSNTGENYPQMCIINCPFTIRKLNWTYALPWNKKRPG